ncbi:MAG: hypothetical protein FWE83_02020 [Oscillospiraceae bacterium]|nr:hypothetical protein [Oscillospiraceae bacterium]
MKKRDKYIISIACALFVIISVLIIALRDRSSVNAEMPDDAFFLDNHILENYIYIAHPAFTLSTSNAPMGMHVHEDTIYYWYYNFAPQVVDQGDGSYTIIYQFDDRNGSSTVQVPDLSRDEVYHWLADLDSEIVIEGLNIDGSSTTKIRIAVSGENVSAGGLRINGDGNFAIIISSFDDESNNTTTYGVYNRQGEVVYKQELIGIDMSPNTTFQIDQVVYADDGNIAIIISNMNDGRLFMIGSDGISRGSLRYNTIQSIMRLQDGRVVALHRYDSDSYLYEIDFEAGDWGDSIALTIPRARNLIQVGENQPFDFLVDNGRNLIGYTLDGNMQTPLLDWLEMRPMALGYTFAGTLSDGRPVIMFNPVYYFESRSVTWNTDIFVLTPDLRAELENRTVLTIGGLDFPMEIQNEVIAFNRENREYQIELREYGGSDIDLDVSKAHFLIDMLTGQGPDIIYDMVNLLGSHDYLMDLYPLIDADPEINRSDFFPNALRAMEAPDGTLPLIGNDFFIYTNITMRETAAQLEPLTFARIRDRLDESDNPVLFGNWLSDFEFLVISVLLSDGGFIDWANGNARFDNDGFIELLELSARLPTVDELTDYFSEMSREEEQLHLEAIQNGNILFYPAYINNINKLRELQTVLGDIVPIGFPTETGGRNVIMGHGSIGINADSIHPDAAWQFVRRLLLPEAAVPAYNALPLRKDRFEELVADMMTPRIVGGVEQSTTAWLGRHTQVELYAMTEEEAADIRALVHNADLPFQYDETVYMILMEESPLFFDGQRTAEATARVIQNRVQAYLDER